MMRSARKKKEATACSSCHFPIFTFISAMHNSALQQEFYGANKTRARRAPFPQEWSSTQRWSRSEAQTAMGRHSLPSTTAGYHDGTTLTKNRTMARALQSRSKERIPRNQALSRYIYFIPLFYHDAFLRNFLYKMKVIHKVKPQLGTHPFTSSSLNFSYS
jgi:hypothetical protein